MTEVTLKDTLLTQKEVSERLRCSTSKIKRLRLDGKLAYLPGRPVLVRESDLNAYIETGLRQISPTTVEKESARKPAAHAAKNEDAYDPVKAARRAWIKRRLTAGR